MNWIETRNVMMPLSQLRILNDTVRRAEQAAANACVRLSAAAKEVDAERATLAKARAASSQLVNEADNE